MDWQAIIAGLIVATAALWLLRRVGRIVLSGYRGGDHLGSCGSCPKNTQAGPSAPAGPLVQLGKKQT